MNDVAHAEFVDSDGDKGFARAVRKGLSQRRKVLLSKYFYDDRGSALFESICELPEYYPTRTEIGLLSHHASEIAALAGPNCELVEFGAGSLRKSRILFSALHDIHSYVPIDISGDYLYAMAEVLGAEYPRLVVEPKVADFTKPLSLHAKTAAGRRIGFFPGSTIGNFSRQGAVKFLHDATGYLAGGALLVGVDLVKDPQILHAAYNDSSNITAAFNKNMLVRANRELGANFDLRNFAHYAYYDLARRSIEMHLVSLVRHDVHASAWHIRFDEGESIHTETSCKYSVDDFQRLAVRAGFSPRVVWTDADKLFSLHWLEAPKLAVEEQKKPRG